VWRGADENEIESYFKPMRANLVALAAAVVRHDVDIIFHLILSSFDALLMNIRRATNKKGSLLPMVMPSFIKHYAGS
jgi:hypothetical protein